MSLAFDRNWLLLLMLENVSKLYCFDEIMLDAGTSPGLDIFLSVLFSI
jgi:hypothetical protein